MCVDVLHVAPVKGLKLELDEGRGILVCVVAAVLGEERGVPVDSNSSLGGSSWWMTT